MNLMKTIVVSSHAEWTIEQSISYAIDTAKRTKTMVDIKINGVWLTVGPESKFTSAKNVYLKLLNVKSK